MDIRPIRNEDDHNKALAEIERLMDAHAKRGTPDGDMLEALATLVEAYEEKRWPIESAKDPVDYLKAVIEASGRTQKDLADLLGSPSRASEILNYDRPLALNHIRKLSSEWGLSAATLVQPYHLRKRASA